MIIRIENSAPSQRISAKSIEAACEFLKNNNINKIADYGCGKLRNLSLLEKYFQKIALVDTELMCERINRANLLHNSHFLYTERQFRSKIRKFDAIFLILVLHTIPDQMKRLAVIKSCIKKLKLGGMLIVDVPTGERYYRHNCSDKNKYNDGWILGRGKIKTFYKQYRALELDNVFLSFDNIIIHKKFTIEKHIVRIYKKM